ncbi:MAG: glycosyltransferase [Anaerolineae bacterium]|jgi:sterol 3beta-glucosyltransferase|nr:glycosyltransferase [Anaerolineae bacterium]
MSHRKLTILTVGTRGDVQPYIALGVALQKVGYQVKIATEAGFEEFVHEYGLDFAPLRADFMRMAQSAEGKAALAGKNKLSLMKQMGPMLRQIMDDAWSAAQGSDAIIYHPKALAGYHIAEKLAVPGFLAMMLPAYSPTRAFATPVLGAHHYGGLLNRFSYWLFLKAAMAPYRGLINSWRREKLGLSPYRDDTVLHGEPVQKLYAYSRQVVPIPVDWDDSTHVTGYWVLPPSEWQPPERLRDFLAQGPAPVYVGFGSMAPQDAERITRIVLEAARLAEQRVILATGWGGLTSSEISDTLFVLESAPHDWLFPRCAAVVHHGGAGTTGAGLRAGKPTVICPFFGDQPFWGQRVAALGVGPRPIPQKKLTVEALARAIHDATTDQEMQQRAQAIGERICAEDGMAEAISIISSKLNLLGKNSCQFVKFVAPIRH